MSAKHHCDKLSTSSSVQYCSFHAQMAANVDVPEEDAEVWRELANFDSPDHILKHPDFYFRNGHIVLVGQVPE